YWQNFLNQFQDTSVREGLSKGESYEWLKMIVLPSQQEVGSMTTQDRDRCFARIAQQVMMFADRWIKDKYVDTLNGGFGGRPVDLSDYTI
ncbi:MAG: hypothetical protein ACK5HO_04845, partial [Pseudomonadota bacterium]